MSHVVKVRVVIRDLDALIKAAESIGLEFVEGRTSYKWFGRWVGDYPCPEGFTPDMLGKCQHVLRVKGNSNAYEVGLVQNADGTWTPLFDFWAGGYGLQNVIGQEGRTLMEAYTLQAARNAVEHQGWMCEETAEGLLAYIPGGGTVTINKAGEVEASGFQGTGCLGATMSIADFLGTPQEQTVKPEMWIANQNLMRGEDF